MRAKRQDPITSVIYSAMPDIEEAVSQALKGGVTKEEVVNMFVDILDSAIVWSVVLPAPWGLIVDAGDGPLLKLIVRGIVNRLDKK